MNIYLIEEKKPKGEYAWFSHVGTWDKRGLCPTCQQPQSRLVEPLLVEWEPGANNVGDFSWCGYTAIVKQTVIDCLMTKQVSFVKGQIEFVASTSKARKGEKTVPYPYVGEVLMWLKPLDVIAVDVDASKLEVISSCPDCRYTKYSFRREGLVVRKADMGNANIFQLAQFPRSDAMFITEDFKKLFEKKCLQNISFHEAGFVV